MPTAARFVAAILFGALGWYVSGLIVPLFPEGTNMGWFTEVNAAIGIFCGWTVAGPRGGTGYVGSFSYGLTTSVAMVALGLFLHSSVVMLENSMRNFYKGPTEAVVAVFELFIKHGQMMLTGEIVGTMVIGGFICGLLTEAVGQRLP